MKKTFKVVMLPTKQSIIGLDKPSNSLVLIVDEKNGFAETEDIQPQHLYILSDEEIKEGDWVYDSSSLPQDAPIKRIRIIDDTHYTFYGDTSRNLKCHYKKIVATTDKSLTEYCKGVHRIGEGCNLNNVCNYPDCRVKLIPESFIQAYIKAYNEAKPITEVDLEMEKKQSHMVDILDSSTWDKWFVNIKTRPDNTVIVHQSKMYTRDEVRKLIINYSFAMGLNPIGGPRFDKWIQENL